MGAELEGSEVREIILSVCHSSTFRHAELVSWEGSARLALPHLETWQYRGTPHVEGQVSN